MYSYSCLHVVIVCIILFIISFFFFFSSRRRHTRWPRDWSSDVCSSDLSFQQDGPLDMRMDRDQALSAADLVNTASAEELARIFWELGGERDSRRLARAITRERDQRPLTTTRQLAELIERLAPRHGRKTHTA